MKPPEEQTVLRKYVPIVNWLPGYRWSEWLGLDLMAAFTVRPQVAPRTLACARNEGVSPEMGLIMTPPALVV